MLITAFNQTRLTFSLQKVLSLNCSIFYHTEIYHFVVALCRKCLLMSASTFPKKIFYYLYNLWKKIVHPPAHFLSSMFFFQFQHRYETTIEVHDVQIAHCCRCFNWVLCCHDNFPFSEVAKEIDTSIKFQELSW